MAKRYPSDHGTTGTNHKPAHNPGTPATQKHVASSKTEKPPTPHTMTGHGKGGGC